MPDSSTFYVIQRPGGAAYFDVRTGSWRRAIESVAGFLTRERATASALEFCLEEQAVVVPYRFVRNARPERMQHDEPSEGLDYM